MELGGILQTLGVCVHSHREKINLVHVPVVGPRPKEHGAEPQQAWVAIPLPGKDRPDVKCNKTCWSLLVRKYPAEVVKDDAKAEHGVPEVFEKLVKLHLVAELRLEGRCFRQEGHAVDENRHVWDC